MTLQSETSLNFAHKPCLCLALDQLEARRRRCEIACTVAAGNSIQVLRACIGTLFLIILCMLPANPGVLP